MADLFLGVEGGGTRTVTLLADAAGQMLARQEIGPCNLRLVSDTELLAHFRLLAARHPQVRALGVGLAGCRDAHDRARVVRVLETLWPGTPSWVDHDLETAWQAAFGSLSTVVRSARIVVVCGTGSCCYGRNSSGEIAKVGVFPRSQRSNEGIDQQPNSRLNSPDVNLDAQTPARMRSSSSSVHGMCSIQV